MAKLEYLVRKSFKVFVENLPKIAILAMACTIIFNHARNVSVDDFLCEVFRICRVKGSAPMLPVYLVSQVLWNFHHLGGLVVLYDIGMKEWLRVSEGRISPGLFSFRVRKEGLINGRCA